MKKTFRFMMVMALFLMSASQVFGHFRDGDSFGFNGDAGGREKCPPATLFFTPV